MPILVPAALSPTVSQVLADYPPPYLLTANLGWFPTTADAGRVRDAISSSVLELRGRALTALLTADYTAIHCGPDRRLVLDGDGIPYRYREVSWLGMTSLGITPGARFGQLWVDAPSDLPLSLGDAYGFPKAAASVAIGNGSAMACEPSDVHAAVSWAPMVGVPAGLVRLTPVCSMTFRATASRANLGALSAQHAQLVRTTDWRGNALAHLHMRPLGWGAYLRQAVVRLGSPE